MADNGHCVMAVFWSSKACPPFHQRKHVHIWVASANGAGQLSARVSKRQTSCKKIVFHLFSLARWARAIVSMCTGNTEHLCKS